MVIFAFVGLFLLLGLTVFQLLLISGKPLGDFAWGGQHSVLPTNLRIASVFSIILYATFAFLLASKAGIVHTNVNEPLLTICMWIVTAYFILGIFVNLISRSIKERALMTPIAFVLALSFVAVMTTTAPL